MLILGIGAGWAVTNRTLPGESSGTNGRRDLLVVVTRSSNDPNSPDTASSESAAGRVGMSPEEFIR